MEIGYQCAGGAGWYHNPTADPGSTVRSAVYFTVVCDDNHVFDDNIHVCLSNENVQELGDELFIKGNYINCLKVWI